jgi:hypothetical protein
MLNIQLIGGLGNMMFQIATMESLAKDYGLEVNYIEAHRHLVEMNSHKRTNTYNSLEYLKIFENFHWNSKISHSLNETIEVPFAFVELHPKDNDCYWGYFQSEKYFKHNKELINYLFTPSEYVINQLAKYDSLFKNKTTCSIHVRRGDYLSYPDTHFIQNMDYFEKALKEIDKVDQYLIFSDDIEWCKNNFTGSNWFDKQMFFVENEKDYVELFLMSKCTHNVCSNSSFSWWGSWLSQNENKKIIAPKKWWAGYDEHIVPETWIKF